MIWINIERNGPIPLSKQIYREIKAQILEGKLCAGEKLPSTRSLSCYLSVSRNVVMEAYEQLYAEGYTDSRQGSGTRVAEGIYLLKGRYNKPEISTLKQQNAVCKDIINFRSGVPALDMFPKREWGRLLSRVCEEAEADFLGYCESEGSMELRKELSEYLFRVRGINSCPEQIIITTGATQGAALMAQLLYSPGAEMAVEDPTNYGLLKVISSPGYAVTAIPADKNGIKTELIDRAKKFEFIYVTPSHQFPLGGILNIKRRIELVSFARNTGTYIIEDDYDSEFRYEGPPVSSLYELDPERVIYIGSFSKILAPALRLGYIILPGALLKRYKSLKKYSDVHTASLEQLALSRFIADGKLDKHITRMKKVYLERQKVLLRELDKRFGGKYTVMGQSTGLHLVAEFEGLEFEKNLLDAARENGVKLYTVEFHAIRKGNHKNKIIMGYGHLDSEKIIEGISRLEKVLRSVL